jgi:hypothetical protein
VRRRWTRAGVIVLGTALVGSCATTGSMTGQISEKGAPARPLTLSYVMDRSGDSGYLSLTLPGGEAFNGPFARIGSAAAVGPGLDIDFSVIDWGEGADTWTFGATDTDKVVALLQGSRGHKIRCRFTLLYPAGGVRSGGSGECQVTSGAQIAVKF